MDNKLLKMSFCALVLVGFSVTQALAATFNVTATVGQSCDFISSAIGDMAFGTIDPASPHAMTTTISVKCNYAAGNVFVGLDNGQNYLTPNRKMKDSASDYIIYNLHKNTVSGPNWGNTGTERQTFVMAAPNVPVSQTVFGDTVATPPIAGIYSDLITATLATT